ncbi:hypothetical protein PoB_001392500 [Plakobranchus ocellatus]|uniref:Uncharacterized protein n=1 Tax=Plakobranchus ocellatus TaxID=259542 RepID=A0AAV3YX04_9GAST|nr:hypothetical protein PoB_001392500 [Plakobranchus ocellatus]
MCELLTGNQGSVNSIPVPDLYSSHEGADSRIILHCMYASQQPTTERVIVRSPDSDVFLLLLSFSDANGKPLIFAPAVETTEGRECVHNFLDSLFTEFPFGKRRFFMSFTFLLFDVGHLICCRDVLSSVMPCDTPCVICWLASAKSEDSTTGLSMFVYCLLHCHVSSSAGSWPV